MLHLRKQAAETMEDISGAARAVADTGERVAGAITPGLVALVAFSFLVGGILGLLLVATWQAL